MSERRFGATTATLLVVASMIGTGVFTTTGFLLRELGSLHAVLLAWALGGVLALFGALAYGELGAALPRSGGEYALVSRIYHPSLGFVAGWVSMIVGFAAPIAATAIAFGKYTTALWPVVPPLAAALVVLLVLSLLNAVRVDASVKFQNVFTAVKVLGIVAFILAGLWFGDSSRVIIDPVRPMSDAAFTPAFAVGLIFVSYAYSGWNAVAYVAGEVKRPGRNVPFGLLVGTAVVTVLYLGLNWVFLSSTTPSELSGVLEVGHVAAIALFGQEAGRLISALIALGLLSTLGAMVLTGARVFEAVGAHYRRLSFLGARRPGGGPHVAIAVQAAIATVMVLTASFDALLTYAGLTLSVSTALTVVGVAVLRWREPDLDRPVLAWGHPTTSLVYVALMGWIVFHTVQARPWAAAAAAGTLASGALVYLMVRGSRTLEA